MGRYRVDVPDDDVRFRVEQVAVGATIDLRNRVLREGAPDSAAWSALDVVGSATFAAYQADRTHDPEPIATVTVQPEGCPWRPGARTPWRLRGMATADEWRGRGVGRRALDVAIAHVADQGAGLLWCNARIGAVAFYERAGFVIEGDEFEVAGIGAHRPMTRASHCVP